MIEAIALTLTLLAQTMTWILFAYVILSWVMAPTHPVRQALNRFVNPLLDPIRRILPQTGPIDFSPIVLFILLQIIETLIRTTFLQ